MWSLSDLGISLFLPATVASARSLCFVRADEASGGCFYKGKGILNDATSCKFATFPRIV